MNIKGGIIIIIVILLVLIFIIKVPISLTNNIQFSSSNPFTLSVGPDIDQKTVDCIASKSKIYIASGCFACAKQENIFGDYFILLNTTDCKIEPQKCVQANITAVPTWVYNENHYEGVHTIDELKEIMSC